MIKTLLHRWALLLLLVAAPAAAQPGGGEHGRPGAGVEAERRPFEVLLEARRELGLTDAQVGRLQGIARELRARNQPLRERLGAEVMRMRQSRRAELERELRSLSPEERRVRLRELMERQPRRDLPPHLRPVAEEMRRNIRQATRQAQQVLTPQQRMRARRMFGERMRERRPGREREHRPRERRL